MLGASVRDLPRSALPGHHRGARVTCTGRAGRSRGCRDSTSRSHSDTSLAASQLAAQSGAYGVETRHSSTASGSYASYAAGQDTRKNNWHLVLNGVYRSPGDARHEQLVVLEELTLKRLDKLDADACITVLYAFGRTQFQPDARILERALQLTEQDMHTLTGRHLEHLAWSLAAMLDRPPPDSWLDAYARALEATWPSFRVPELAGTLVNMAACGLAHLTPATTGEQLPALLRKAAAPGTGTSASTLSKLVFAAGHYNATGAATMRSGEGALGVELWAACEAAQVVEQAEAGDLVLLTYGLAQLGVMSPGGVQGGAAGSLLQAAGSGVAVAQLDVRLLSLLAFSALKMQAAGGGGGLGPGVGQRSWVGGLADALVAWLREEEEADEGGAAGAQGGRACGSGAGGGGTLPGFATRPADVALALSSLAGLGELVSAGEVVRYWRGRGGRYWQALAPAERATLTLLGYSP